MTEYSDDMAEQNMNRIEMLSNQFVETQHFLNLSELQQDEAEFILMTFTDYMYSYHGEIIGEWTLSEVKECCCETLSRKVSADESYYNAISPVLIAFFNFLEEEKIIKKSAEFTKLLTNIAHKIVASSENPENWGMAKSFFAMGKKSGLDMQTEEGVNAFVAIYNQRLLEKVTNTKTNTIPIVKTQSVGRNEPCPCGSGKKYKKCCLNS